MSERTIFGYRLTRRGLVKAGAVGAVAVAGCNCFGAGPAAAQTRYKITLIVGVKADEFYISMGCGAQRVASQLGVDLTIQGPASFDPSLQIPILNAVVQSKPDAILIAPTNRTALIAPIQDAVNKGIAVFTVDTLIEKDIALANIASDNVEGGRIAGRTLAELIGGKGSVYVTNVKPGISTTDQRQQGFEEAIKAYPNITYVGAQYNNDDPTQAASQTAAILRQHPDLAGIFATNLFGAEGAGTAIREAGKQGKVKIVGFDAGPKIVKDLRDGVIDVLIAQHPLEIGETAVRMAVDYLKTKTPPAQKVVHTGYTVVTRNNINQPDVARYLYVADCSQLPPETATPVASPVA